MIFEITPQHIERLSDTDLRILVGKLAEQVLMKAGHSSAGVTYGGHQNASDGGIDVRVSLPADAIISGYVPKPSTGFQVKAEDMSRSAILSEMKPGGILRESIRALGRQAGAYIIASSKGSVTDTALSARKNAMGEAVAADPEAASLHVDFYDRQRLSSWVNENPGLIPWVRDRAGQPLQGWQPFTDWSSTPGPADTEYVVDSSLRLVGTNKEDAAGIDLLAGIDRLRATVRTPGCAVRLLGLSGVGKTRLVQALFDDRIGTGALNPDLAVYTDIGDEPSPVPLELLSHIGALNQRIVLIVDNCGMDLHKKLVNRIRTTASQVSVITVEYDIRDDEPEGTDVFRLEPSSADVLQKILGKNYPDLTAADAATIAHFSDGNARIALALANTARNGESLANLKDSDLFERLFRQRHDVDHTLLAAAKACALVYSFDGETLDGPDAELPLLAGLAGQPVQETYARISELQRRQLVQKRSRWRAILPHALANRLARQALEDIPAGTLQNVFMQQAPERLRLSFSRRLGYLHDCAHAEQLVDRWLCEDGYLSRIEDLDETGLAFLLNVAPITPGKVLHGIRRAIGRAQELAEPDHPGRGPLISLLRHLAYDAEHFEEAAELLALWSMKDPDTNRTGHARQVFVSLFSIYLSGTHASARQRAGLLERLSESADDKARDLARLGTEAMLRCDSFSSGYDFSFGARPRGYGYHPTQRSDIRAWYCEAFELAAKLGNSDQEPLLKIRAHVAGQFGWIAKNTGLADELIRLARSFMAKGDWPGGWAGVRSAVRRARAAGQDEVAGKLEKLAADLAPTSLSERISSFVLSPGWSAPDIADIDEDDENTHREAQAFVDAVCAEIGAELAEDPEALTRELPRLVTGSSRRAGILGKGLAQSPEDPEVIWEKMVLAYLQAPPEDSNYALLTGFMIALLERLPEAASRLLEKEMDSKRLSGELVHWQVIAGFANGGFDRLMRILNQDRIPAYAFRILGHGGSHKSLDSGQMTQFLRALARRGDDGVECAIDILHMRYYGYRSDNEPVPGDEKPVGRDLLSMFAFGRSRDVAHDLAAVARSCLEVPLDEPVVRTVCRHLRAALERREVRGWTYHKLVRFLATEFPEAVLDEFVGHADMRRGFRREMFATLRDEGACIFSAADPARVLNWVKGDPAARASRLAEAIGFLHSSGTDNTQEWTPLALSLIEETPVPEPVLNIFYERFRPNSWSGSRAGIMERRMPLLRALENHPDTAIRQWARKTLPDFLNEIESERRWEEQRDRDRDERFE